jgi:hypothetical protein
VSKGWVILSQKNKVQEERQTRRGIVLYEESPFMPAMTMRTRKVINKRGDMMLVSAETGEVAVPIAGFWESEAVDSTKFVKLFINGVKALKELTASGTKVFEVLYLLVQENIGKDKIFISFSEINQMITPVSFSTYKRGMRELISKGFIAATPSQGMYWLNPDFVWNGDRLAFVKEYRKEGTKPKVSIGYADSEES